MNGQVRQGDILFIPAEKPGQTTAIETKRNRIIIAEGEATGHHHSITLERPGEATLYTVADEVDRWLQVHSVVEVGHEEHRAAPLVEPGYTVRRQVEHTPAAVRRVAD